MTNPGTLIAEMEGEFNAKTNAMIERHVEQVAGLRERVRELEEQAEKYRVAMIENGHGWQAASDAIAELKADAVRFNIHLEQKDRALKANAEEYRRLREERDELAQRDEMLVDILATLEVPEAKWFNGYSAMVLAQEAEFRRGMERAAEIAATFKVLGLARGPMGEMYSRYCVKAIRAELEALEANPK